MTSWEFAVPVPFPNGIYIAIYKVKMLQKVCLKGYIRIPQEMSQSIYGKFQGRDNSCTSGEAASAGIENSPRVTKGLSQFPKNGLAGVVK